MDLWHLEPVCCGRKAYGTMETAEVQIDCFTLLVLGDEHSGMK